MLIEKLEKSGDGMRNTLYGSKAYDSKCIAFCWNHHKWLTVTQMKRHECLGRRCGALERRIAHPYWAEREKKKQLRKERRKRLNGKLSDATGETHREDQS